MGQATPVNRAGSAGSASSASPMSIRLPVISKH